MLREPILLLLASGVIGWFLGRGRGRGRRGFFLGLLLGPLGWLLNSLKARVMASRGGFGGARAEGPASGPACARCRAGVGAGDKVCGRCGNVLAPVSYRVE